MQTGNLAFVAIAMLTVGLAAAIGNNRTLAEQAAMQTVEMHIRRNASGIEVSGHVSSPANEAILLEILRQPESPTRTSIDLTQADLSPPGWALLTELALQATLLTRFSETTVDTDGATISGVTNEPVAWSIAVNRLQAALLPGMQLETRVVELAPAPAFTSLCRDEFTAAIDKGPLQFAAGRSEIDSRARAMLDSLNETAADCTKWHINVRVRGDGSSRVDFDLAAARAQSIVAYLTAHGLLPQRISAATELASPPGRHGQAVFSVSPNDDEIAQTREASATRNNEGSALPTAAPLAN